MRSLEFGAVANIIYSEPQSCSIELFISVILIFVQNFCLWCLDNAFPLKVQHFWHLRRSVECVLKSSVTKSIISQYFWKAWRSVRDLYMLSPITEKNLLSTITCYSLASNIPKLFILTEPIMRVFPSWKFPKYTKHELIWIQVDISGLLTPCVNLLLERVIKKSHISKNSFHLNCHTDTELKLDPVVR